MKMTVESNKNLETVSKVRCANCNKLVEPDEIITVHDLAGNWHDECEWCVSD